MSRSLLILILLTASHCSYYDHDSERCKIKEYYNYDGVEYNKCYE